MAANVAGSSSKPKVFPMRVKGEHVLLAINILLAEVSTHNGRGLVTGFIFTDSAHNAHLDR